MNNIKIDWYKNAVIYQIYPRSFYDSNGDGVGDIKGIIAKLDYLKDLGINCVWLSPIYKSPQEDNGYDISDYRDIYEPFGTFEDFKSMLQEMHKRDIKLIMDLVVNHTSSEHIWFKEAIKDKNSKYRDYYIFKKGKRNGKKPPNNWTGFFGESTWEKEENNDEYYLHLFAKGQPDLNWENVNVRNEVKDILKFYFDLGVDGFRCDVITLISKKQDFKSRFPSLVLTGKDAFINGPRLHEYLHELNSDVISKYDVMTVGETVFSTTKQAIDLINPQREELTMIFNFDHTDVDNYFGVKYFYRKFKLRRLKKVYDCWQIALDNKGWNSLFIENHDQRRSVGRFNLDESSKYRELSAKALAASYFLLKGTPFIYQGQEIGMRNAHFKNIDETRDVEVSNFYKMSQKHPFIKLLIGKHIFDVCRDNARTPMQWDKTKNAGFSSGEPWIRLNNDYEEINVEDSLKRSDSLYHFYQKLIKFRVGNKTIYDGHYVDLAPKHRYLYAYMMKRNDDEVVVLINFRNKNVKHKLVKRYANYNIVLQNYDDINLEYLRPFEVRIYEK